MMRVTGIPDPPRLALCPLACPLPSLGVLHSSQKGILAESEFVLGSAGPAVLSASVPLYSGKYQE